MSSARIEPGLRLTPRFNRPELATIAIAPPSLFRLVDVRVRGLAPTRDVPAVPDVNIASLDYIVARAYQDARVALTAFLLDEEAPPHTFLPAREAFALTEGGRETSAAQRVDRVRAALHERYPDHPESLVNLYS